MTIETGNPVSQPALDYKYIHIVSYSFRVEKTPPYRHVVDELGQKYAVNANGERVFSDEKIQFSSTDFQPVVGTWLIQNGYATDEADIQAKKAAAKTAVNDEWAQGVLDPIKLMAYFEFALGLQLQIGAGEPLQGIS